jgi:hypothetical protein
LKLGEETPKVEEKVAPPKAEAPKTEADLVKERN